MKRLLLQSSIVFIQAEPVQNITTLFVRTVIDDKILPKGFSQETVKTQFLKPVITHLGDGYSITEEPERLLIQVEYPESKNLDKLNKLNDKLPAFARNIKNIAKRANFSAVGINFKALINFEDQSSDNPFSHDDKIVQSMKYRQLGNEFIGNVAIEAVFIGDKEPKNSGFVFDLNCHFNIANIPQDKKYSKINEILRKRNECFQMLKEVINDN